MYFKTIFLLPLMILLSLFSQASIYENGESNITENWSVYSKEKLYDKNSTLEVMETVFDKDRDSKVIKLKGIEMYNTYVMGDINGSKNWNNTKESIFTWSMKIKKSYQIILFVNTKNGIRYIYFSDNKNLKLLNNNQYIHIPLETLSEDEKWQTFHFDIASIIKTHQKNNRLISINGFSIQGLGVIDDVKLESNQNDFITTWNITNDNNLTISTNNLYTYNFNIIWGDGEKDTNITKTVTHHYKKSGIYSLNINGEYPHIYKTCNKNQNLLSIEQWGKEKWKSMKESFKDCHEFKSINTKKAPDLSAVQNMYRMFYNADKFNGELSSWNTSSVTDMGSMFNHAKNFNQNIGEWDVSSVKDMSFMFKFAKQFNQDITQWNVSSVKDMQLMFQSAEKFNQDISNWNVSSVKNFYKMFENSKAFNQNLDKWNVSSVQNHSKNNLKEKIIPENASVVSDIYNNLEQLNSFNE